jgi:hypothetical protein
MCCDYARVAHAVRQRHVGRHLLWHHSEHGYDTFLVVEYTFIVLHS